MQPRAKTLVERLGFQDPDRRNFKHDEIQIWAYNNFASIVKNVFPRLNVDDKHPLDVTLEYPVSDQGYKKFIVGFVDVYCGKLSIGIEVKTEISIIGDLVRQIQFYRNYCSAAWIVVSPDDRGADILKKQGIHFFKYRGRNVDKAQLQLF